METAIHYYLKLESLGNMDLFMMGPRHAADAHNKHTLFSRSEVNNSTQLVIRLGASDTRATQAYGPELSMYYNKLLQLASTTPDH